MEHVYQTQIKIGQGTYGTVFKTIDKFNQTAAVKHIKMQNQNQGIPFTALRQIAILKQLNHPNIIKSILFTRLFDVIYQPFNKKLVIVLQLMDLDMRKFLQQNHDLPIKKCVQFMYQLLSALNYCHSRKIVHRDIKPQNLLIGSSGKAYSQGNLKVADFGLARTIHLPSKKLSRQMQTLWYRPPEVILGQQNYFFGVDIWAAGLIFAQMIQGHPLLPGDCEIDQLYKIFKLLGTPSHQQWSQVQNLPDYKKSFPKFKKGNLKDNFTRADSQCIDLIQKLVVLNPNKRLSAVEALEHDLFKDMNL